MLALKQARENGNLWWQVRAFQELGWEKELHDFVLQNAKEIEKLGDLTLSVLLADARGDKKKSIELRKTIVRNTRSAIMGEDESEYDDGEVADAIDKN